MRGYFEIGIYRPKTPMNLGTLWRSAYQMGAAGIFVVGQRWPEKQSSDTLNSWKHVPLRKYADLEALLSAMPFSCPLVGIEMGGKPLHGYAHPERAIYLLGAEDNGLPSHVSKHCHAVVELPSVRTASFNVAVAGSLVMYDRLTESNTKTGPRSASSPVPTSASWTTTGTRSTSPPAGDFRQPRKRRYS